MHWGLVIFGMVAVLFLWVLYKISLRNWAVVHIKNLNQQVHEAFGGACPPMRIKLTPLEEARVSWNHKKYVEKATRSLLSLGFEPAGDFQVYSNSLLLIRGFVHSGHGIRATVYDFSEYQSWVDFSTIYGDGTVWTYSTMWDTKKPVPPWGTLKRYPETDLPALLERFLAERPSEGICPISCGDFVDSHEATHARYMDWLAERGGYTDDEFRAISAAPIGHFSRWVLNRLKFTEDQVLEEEVTKFQQQWRERVRQHLESQAREMGGKRT